MAADRLARAREAGAAHYAPELLREAEGAIADARRNLSRPETYRAAIRAAALASLRADEARALAREGRRKPTAEAVRLLMEAEALIEQARSLDGPGRFGEEIDRLERWLASSRSALEKGEPEKARQGAYQLKGDLLALHRRLKEPR